MNQTRRLAAILAADVAGYSRLMEADEEGALARLKSLRRDPIDPKIALWKGRIVKTAGDGMLGRIRERPRRRPLRGRPARRDRRAQCRDCGRRADRVANRHQSRRRDRRRG
jgi:class 3 adenylate cyclase